MSSNNGLYVTIMLILQILNISNVHADIRFNVDILLKWYGSTCNQVGFKHTNYRFWVDYTIWFATIDHTII